MDATAHYRHLIALGRDEFLAAAAPAALVRVRSPALVVPEFLDHTQTLDQDPLPEANPGGMALGGYLDLEVYPIVKKPGASFPDRITIGRTSNNDIVVANHSISRLHAYVRPQATGWVVADAGSKNGSWLHGEVLEARRERPLPSRLILRLGDVDLTFYVAADLFAALGGS